MIRAVAWCRLQDCGVVAADGGAPALIPTPDLADHPTMTGLIDRPLKHLSRMTNESRLSLWAAHLALGAVQRHDAPWAQIGLLAAGDGGFLQADATYFRDYVDSGRSMGRGNLFIYTLPTSALGEVAIALNLTGPSLYLHDDAQPLQALVRHARQLISDGEADAILAFWSDLAAVICVAVDGLADSSSFCVLDKMPQSSPDQMAHDLANSIRETWPR